MSGCPICLKSPCRCVKEDKRPLDLSYESTCVTLVNIARMLGMHDKDRYDLNVIEDNLARIMMERTKVRDAIRRAGYSVYQTSGEWHICDISERGKKDLERSREIVNENIELKMEIVQLKKELGR